MSEATHTPQPSLGLALSAYESGKLVEAEQLCRQILIAKPDHVNALHLLANVQFGLGKKEMALASYDRVLAVHPRHAEVLCNRGLTLHQLNRLGDALASYDRALALRPDYPEALSNRGNT